MNTIKVVYRVLDVHQIDPNQAEPKKKKFI